jgi:hypothetical protein
VETLVKEGVGIVNNYSDLYAATVDSTKIVGHDDYKRVLKCARARREQHKAESDRFYEQARAHERARAQEG